jgi:transposase
MSSEVTVVFDRGNNSELNLDLLESGDKKQHYIAGLKKNQLPELFAIPRKKYVELKAPNLARVTAYRTISNVFSRDLVTVISHNPELEKGQLQGLIIEKDKIIAKLKDIQDTLTKRLAKIITKGKKPTVDSVTKTVATILKAEYMDEIFSYKVFMKNDNVILSFSVNEKAIEKIKATKLGITAFFTDRRDLSTEMIVNMYRSAWHVESAFKQLKDTSHNTVRPMFHWTDEKIRVHIFDCVLALRLCSLLVKELYDKGIHTSINAMIEAMSEITKVTTFFKPLNKPTKVNSFTKAKDLGARIESIYQLQQKYGS